MMNTLLTVPIIWILKSATFWLAFRYRTVQATVMDCLIIAGAPLLLSIIPLPLPSFLFIVASTGLAVYLTMHYTGVSLIPDGLFIPVGVEAVFQVGLWVLRESGVLT